MAQGVARIALVHPIKSIHADGGAAFTVRTVASVKLDEAPRGGPRPSPRFHPVSSYISQKTLFAPFFAVTPRQVFIFNDLRRF
jgi:hypothetical protein